MIAIIATVFIIALFGWIFYVLRQKPSDDDNEIEKESSAQKDKQSKKAGASKPASKKKKEIVKPDAAVPEFVHPWLIATLKGHTNDVHSIELSPNGHLLASAAEDRTVLLWTTKDFHDRNHKQFRVNVELDSARQVSWSPDNKAFIIARSDDSNLEVFKLGKKPDGSIGNIHSAITFPKVHQDELVGTGIACNGNYIMSCGKGNLLILWDIKGNVLAQKLVGDPEKPSCLAKISPCARYFAACGENCGSTIIVHAIKFTNNGNFDDITEGFKLAGHKRGAYSLDFNMDSSKIITVDSELCWRLFDTTGGQVGVFRSGKLTTNRIADSIPTISLSPDCRLIVAGVSKSIELYSVRTGNQLHIIENAHSEPIKQIIFSAKAEYFITCGDRIIRVFDNICGIREKKEDLTEQIKDQSLSQALRNRLTSELKLLKEK